jgi:hypothetical protein
MPGCEATQAGTHHDPASRCLDCRRGHGRRCRTIRHGGGYSGESLNEYDAARKVWHQTWVDSSGTLLLFNFAPVSARLELGYVLGQAHWGLGLMREALRSACAHAFGSLGIRRLEAEVNSSNVASMRVLRNLGFVHEGTLRKRWIAKGEAYDTDMYGLLAGAWSESANAG